jgi:hypothetical protein
VRDKRDKVLSKLYMYKLEALLNRRDHQLSKCSSCGKLYTASQREWMVCPRGKPYVDFRGKVLARHTPNAAWDVSKYLASLRQSKMSWRDMYWKLFGRVRHLQCVLCKQQFPICEYQHCAYHASEPMFPPQENAGFYPCCGTPARRFTAVQLPTGCVGRKHTVMFDSSGSDATGSVKGQKEGKEREDEGESKDIDDELTPRDVYDVLLKHMDVTTVAFRPNIPSSATEVAGSNSTRRGGRGEEAEGSAFLPISTFAEYSLGHADDVAVYTYGFFTSLPSALLLSPLSNETQGSTIECNIRPRKTAHDNPA